MKRISVLLFFVCLPFLVSGQRWNPEPQYVGFIFSFDEAYNFKDKLLTPSLNRKASAGISFTNRNCDFIVFLSAGIKGIKFNIYTPEYQEEFLNDVRQNYVPITGSRDDSLVAASMYHLANKEEGYNFWGNYGQYLEAGFIWTKSKIRPTVDYYIGLEQFALYGKAFLGTKASDPDFDYVTMGSVFHEVKLGLAIPVENSRVFCFHLKGGYKWVNYAPVSLDGTPLSDYTTGNIAERYSRTGKFTISASFTIWTNWLN